jgi:hypothetical protein
MAADYATGTGWRDQDMGINTTDLVFWPSSVCGSWFSHLALSMTGWKHKKKQNFAANFWTLP